MRVSTEKEIQPSGLETKLKLQEIQVTSENLPKNVSLRLYELMNDVVKADVTPNTVRAACQCASEIHKILKLNHEMRKDSKL